MHKYANCQLKTVERSLNSDPYMQEERDDAQDRVQQSDLRLQQQTIVLEQQAAELNRVQQNLQVCKRLVLIMCTDSIG